jgi:cytochrome P450
MTANVGASPSLPPGRLGLPFVGETLAFLKNPFAFLAERQKRYGKVFKSSLVGRRIVFLSGTEGAEAFFDSDNISRADAHPFPLVDLFGGINMEMYDGPKHQALKAMALTAFDHAAIAGYLPHMQAGFESSLARLAAASEFSGTAELRKLAIEAIAQNVMGLGRGAETDAICEDYGRLLRGLTSLPVPLPGTPYARARAARDRLLATIRKVVGQRRAHPGDDALSRMLTARAADGRVYTDDEAVLEVHHIVIAGFIVYGLMAEAMRRLAEDPALAARCTAEVSAHAALGPLTLETLAKLRLCTQVVLETKRFAPLVPLAFGRAKRTFTSGGHQVPEGWTVYLALSLNNNDPAIYRDPERFDPDRFGPERAEHKKHPLAFIPQGAEPPTGHRCLGLEYSTFLTLTFMTVLLRGFTWELPAQDLSNRWTMIPPEPRDGLRIRLRAR